MELLRKALEDSFAKNNPVTLMGSLGHFIPSGFSSSFLGDPIHTLSFRALDLTSTYIFKQLQFLK